MTGMLGLYRMSEIACINDYQTKRCELVKILVWLRYKTQTQTQNIYWHVGKVNCQWPMYKYINTQNMASDQTKVLNTIAKYNYNTFIHTHK